MRLSDHDLLQLTEEELLELPEDVLRRLSVKLLYDLKEARERLKQTSKNSSRPPSSDLPWDKAGTEPSNSQPPQEPDEYAEVDEQPRDSDKTSETKPEKTQDIIDEVQQAVDSEDAASDKRKPGKQPGAPGYGREQKIAITAEEHHYPAGCARCDRELPPNAAKAYTAFETVDLVWADLKKPGIALTNTKNTYYETVCDCCGHCTKQAPHRQVSHALTPNIILSEWRLVGPGLAALIVCLAYRMRLSRKRIQEFLYDWLALEISVGTINATLHESGAAALPIEEELVQAVQDSGLLHVDETSWHELTTLLWLWVFCGQNVVVYWIASRGSELLNNVLGDRFQGWLMSDGWQAYRYYLKRLRCWAHLIRKAEGLKDSLDVTACLFGEQTLLLLDTLMGAVYAARESPAQPLSIIYQDALSDYQSACEGMCASPTHEKARALAVEMLNDWEAIFQVLAHPHLPLTNNEAEQALRHWVILRAICHGTRTEDGTRILAILISVIETCRVRQQSPWVYLAAVIHQRRAGLPVPRLPVAKGSE